MSAQQSGTFGNQFSYGHGDSFAVVAARAFERCRQIVRGALSVFGTVQEMQVLLAEADNCERRAPERARLLRERAVRLAGR